MKDERIIIRCSSGTKRRFKVLVAEKGFKDYEEALKYLLELHERFGNIRVEVFP